MTDIEFNWEEGEVGNYWLTTGLVERTAHAYQTPWTGEIWWAESTVFGIERTCFESEIAAKTAIEQAAKKWFQLATFKAHEDHIWIFTDSL